MARQMLSNHVIVNGDHKHELAAQFVNRRPSHGGNGLAQRSGIPTNAVRRNQLIRAKGRLHQSLKFLHVAQLPALWVCDVEPREAWHVHRHALQHDKHWHMLWVQCAPCGHVLQTSRQRWADGFLIHVGNVQHLEARRIKARVMPPTNNGNGMRVPPARIIHKHIQFKAANTCVKLRGHRLVRVVKRLRARVKQ